MTRVRLRVLQLASADLGAQLMGETMFMSTTHAETPSPTLASRGALRIRPRQTLRVAAVTSARVHLAASSTIAAIGVAGRLQCARPRNRSSESPSPKKCGDFPALACFGEVRPWRRRSRPSYIARLLRCPPALAPSRDVTAIRTARRRRDQRLHPAAEAGGQVAANSSPTRPRSGPSTRARPAAPTAPGRDRINRTASAQNQGRSRRTGMSCQV